MSLGSLPPFSTSPAINIVTMNVIFTLLALIVSAEAFSASTPPPGAPPTSKGPPGAPPPPTRVQRVLDATFNAAFSGLYLFDRSGVKDSSKNLRVLWTRALLDKQGRLEDSVAFQLLPRGTRRIISWPFTKAWRLTSKYDWIVDRTNFIDSEVDAFLEEFKEGERQVVLLGSGEGMKAL